MHGESNIKYIGWLFCLTSIVCYFCSLTYCTGHTQKNGAVTTSFLLKPHHSFVYALYKAYFLRVLPTRVEIGAGGDRRCWSDKIMIQYSPMEVYVKLIVAACIILRHFRSYQRPPAVHPRVRCKRVVERGGSHVKCSVDGSVLSS